MFNPLELNLTLGLKVEEGEMKNWSPDRSQLLKRLKRKLLGLKWGGRKTKTRLMVSRDLSRKFGTEARLFIECHPKFQILIRSQNSSKIGKIRFLTQQGQIIIPAL